MSSLTPGIPVISSMPFFSPVTEVTLFRKKFYLSYSYCSHMNTR